MRTPRTLQDVLRADLCISCGACVAASGSGHHMKMPPEKKHRIPDLPADILGRHESVEAHICPGRGLPLEALSEECFGACPQHCLELGRFHRSVVARATDPSLLRTASSGGVMTAIGLHLIETGRVTGMTAARYTYGVAGPRPESLIASDRQTLLTCQGSKYIPTETCSLVPQCTATGNTCLFSGTPCQVGALQQWINRDPSLKKTFPLTMANFCGGYRDYSFVDWLLAKYNIERKDVRAFQFRGNGQPGELMIRHVDGREFREPYPDYYRGTTVPKMKRCNLCIDATGELADFSCGDAWLEKYLKDAHPWSIVLLRSREAVDIFQEMIDSGSVLAKDISAAEVIASQKSNITAKKYRFRKKARLYEMAGSAVPRWDSVLPNTGTYRNEIRILLGKYLMKFRTFRRLRARFRHG